MSSTEDRNFKELINQILQKADLETKAEEEQTTASKQKWELVCRGYNPEEEGTYWTQQLKWNTRRSGQKLLDYIGTLQDERPQQPLKILDVGCGENEWKSKLGGRLLGIDPYHPNADIMMGINE